MKLRSLSWRAIAVAILLGGLVVSAGAIVSPSISGLMAIGDPTTPSQQMSVNALGQAVVACSNCIVANSVSALATALPATSKCLATIDAGTATSPCNVLCVGTSLTFGYQDNTNDPTAANYCAQMAKMLNGLPLGTGSVLRADYDGFAGAGQTELRNTLYTSQITNFGTCWTNNGGSGTQIFIGGGVFWLQHGASCGNVTVHPFNTTDHCTLTALTASGIGLGRIQAQLGSGSIGTLNTNSTGGVQALTVTATLGSNNLVITDEDSTVDDVFFFTAQCWNSANLGLSFMNAGAYGTTSTQWAASSDSPWDATDLIHNASNTASLNPTLCLVELLSNDPAFSISVATFGANMAKIAASCQAGGGDVVFLTPSHPNACPNYCDSAFAPYIAEMKAIAAATPQGAGTVPVIDITNCFVSAAYEATQGWIAADNEHMTNTGYAAWARCALPVFRSMLGL